MSGETYGYLDLSEKAGGFDDDDEAVVTALAAAAAAPAVAIQNAELYAIERRRETWLTAGQRITTMLLEGADQEEVRTTIAATAREIDGADTAVLVLPGVGGELVMEIVDGHARDELVGLPLLEGSRSVEVFRTGVGDTAPSSITARHPLEPGRARSRRATWPCPRRRRAGGSGLRSRRGSCGSGRRRPPRGARAHRPGPA